MRLRLLILVSFLFPMTSSAEKLDECVQNLMSTAIAQGEMAKATAQQKWSGKLIVFDTNVLLNDPNSIFKYPGAQIVIPGAVINEIDNHKKDEKTGRAARAFSRTLRELNKKYRKINKPVPLNDLDDGTTIMVDSKNYVWLLNDTAYHEPIPDNLIIATALYYAHEWPDSDDVYLVSDDSNVQIKASSEDVQTMGSEYEWVTVPTENVAEVEKIRRIRVSAEQMTQFKATGTLPKPEDFQIAPNEFAMLQLEGDEEAIPSVENVVRYFFDRKAPEASHLRRLLLKTPALPFPAKNLEQTMALELLLDPSIDLVISQSPAGTGKTFITLMAGYVQQKTSQNPQVGYDQLLVTRTLVQIGKTDLGALPGGQDEKLAPFNENYADAIKAFQKKNMGPASPNGGASAVAETLDRSYKGIRSQKVVYKNKNKGGGAKKGDMTTSTSKKGSGYTLMAFPHIRGRSIQDSFIVMDEAQNSSVHEMKTFLTRAGEGSKMVILGDASQIDVPYLNESNNGLSVTASLVLSAGLTLEERSHIGYVKLTEGVRSALAEIAVKLFDSKNMTNN